MKLMKIIVLLILFKPFMPISLFAQDFYADLKKIKQNYVSPERQISYKIKVKYFDKHNLNHPIDSSIGSYSFYKDNAFMSIEGMTMISNNNMNVFVSDSAKSIYISGKFKVRSLEISIGYLDSILQNNKIRLTDRISGKTKTVNFKFSKEVLDSIVISYNINSFLLEHVFVYYNVRLNEDYDFPPVIEINYSKQEQLNIPNLLKFNTENIFTVSNEQIILRSKYKKYELKTNLKF
jgi:hypothetical protein